MGREIEVKLPLTEELFVKILNWLCGHETKDNIQTKNPELIFKSDEYYSQYTNHQERLANEPRVIRLRTEKKQSGFIEALKGKKYSEIKNWLYQKEKEKNPDSTAFFTIKTKQIENGMEFNKEDETYIQDADVLREFFNRTKFLCWFKKEKIAFGSMVQLIEKKDRISKKESESHYLTFHLELELVNGLPYIEIEYTGEKESSETVKNQLNNLLKNLNLSDIKKRNPFLG